MAQEQGAAGHDGDEPEVTGDDAPDVPALPDSGPGAGPGVGPDEGRTDAAGSAGSSEAPTVPGAAPAPARHENDTPVAPGQPAAAAAGGAGEGPDAPELWGRNGMVGDGRYRLTRRLGRGGMADVFAAEDVRLGRLVAVKLLRPDLAEDAVAKARFTREAQSVAGLNHHAVVAVYDSGEEEVGGVVGAVPYIVMELVNGHTIRELLNQEEGQTPGQTLAIVAGVLEALAYSHQHGIVHRDIKPANVIITETGSVKVMDFGIARALHGVQNTMTQTGMVMGTPQYLSPEQALGKAVDTRSDLYAVGCLLYELLTQRPPFTGETPLSVVYQHVQDTARLPSEVTEASPPELDGLVMRSLAKDPDDRFQSAEEMRSLVLYAARMLQTHGGHTAGLWNTGSVTADTPAMGTPSVGPAPTGRMGAPLLLGEPGGEGDPDKGAARPGRLRYVLIALLAVCAITVGTLIALNAGGDGGENPRQNREEDRTPVEEEKTSPPPTEEEDPADPTEDADPPTAPWTPTPQPDPTWTPTEDPTTNGGAGGDDEGTDGGTTEGTDEGTDGGTTEGTDEGATDDGGNGADTGDPTDGGGSGDATGDPGATEGGGDPATGGQEGATAAATG